MAVEWIPCGSGEKVEKDGDEKEEEEEGHDDAAADGDDGHGHDDDDHDGEGVGWGANSGGLRFQPAVKATGRGGQECLNRRKKATWR